MAEKQLDKLVANVVHSLQDFKLERELLVLDFLKKDSAIDVAPGIAPLVDGDSIPFLDSSMPINTPRSVRWIRTTIVGGRLTSIGGALIRTDLSIANKNATTLDILSSSGDDITVPTVTDTFAGLMSAAGFNKLATIEPYADVTDKENVGAAIVASPTKTTPTGSDYVAIIDSVGNVLSKTLWSNVAQTSIIGTQTLHGFSVGNTIKPTSTGWELTKADSVDNAGTVGVVSFIIDANTFRYVVEGIVPGTYVAGENYFLSPTTAGGMIIRNGSESWNVGEVVEYIGTGVESGLYVQVGVGVEVSDFLIIDKYSSGVTFNPTTRLLSIQRTGGLPDITATIANIDTLDTILTRGNTSTLGATFGATVATNILTSSSISTPVLKLTVGAVADYIWKCTNVDGTGVWAPATASNVYKGTWNALTNTPTLADGVGTAGWYYRVTTAGTWNGIAFSVGDDIIYNGLIWQRIPSQTFSLVPATASVLGGVKIGTGVSVTLDGFISVSTNYQAPLSGTGLVYSTAGVISYDTNTYATQLWVTTNFSDINHVHTGVYVPVTRAVNTTNSLTGGGSLSTDRTLSLVNDLASPGSYKVYGTDITGTKGWQPTYWTAAAGGVYYPGGYVAIGNMNPLAPLHVQYSVLNGFATIINNTNANGHGISLLANDTAFEVKDKFNVANPAFQILGNGTIKWQLATASTGDRLVYYNTTTKQLSVGALITGISLTSLSATAPILYNNLTGVFSMAANAYAPFSTVSFPGFGTNHTTAAYGDHVHGHITSVGAIGSVSGLPIITTTAGVLTTGAFGLTAGTFCAGDDSRLSNARTPTAHNLIDTVNHPVSGLTTGHFLKALSATTYGFAAHGLTYTDVGAAPISGSVNYIWNQTALDQAGSFRINGTGILGSTIQATTAKLTSLSTTSFALPYNNGTLGLADSAVTYTGLLVSIHGSLFTFSTSGAMNWGGGTAFGALYNSGTTVKMGALSGSDLTLVSRGNDRLKFPDAVTTQLVDLTFAGTGSRMVISSTSGVVTTIVDGTAGQYLTTNGAGVYTWNTITGGAGGTVTNIATGTGLSGGPITTTGTINLALNNLAEKTGSLVGADRLVGVSGTAHFSETISGIQLSIFNNDLGWTTNTGTVTSVSAGAGLSFTTITSTGSIILGTPSTVGISTLNSVSGSTHTHVLDLSGRTLIGQFSITGGGTLGADRTFYLVGDSASPGNSMFYGTSAVGSRGWYALENQTITLVGHVAGSGKSSITTTIQPNVVALNMLTTIATSSFLGRITAATGNVEVLTVANVRSMLGLGTAAYTDSTAYAPSVHSHPTLYEPLITKSTGYAKWNGSAWTFLNDTYSLDGHTHSSYQPLDDDLTAIAALPATAGFLRKVSANNWTIDTSSYFATPVLNTDTVPYWNGSAFANSAITRGVSSINVYGSAFTFASASGSFLWGNAGGAYGYLGYNGTTVEIGALSGSNTLNIKVGGSTNAIFTTSTTTLTTLTSTKSRIVIASASGVLSGLSDGTLGQVLTTDGSGNYSWGAGGGASDGNYYPTGMSVAGNILSLTSSNGMPTVTLTLLAGSGTAATASHSDHTHLGVYEPVLGNPASNGYVLSSTTLGVRSWVAPTSYSLPLAANGVRGGIMISGVTPPMSGLLPVLLFNESPYVGITQEAVEYALSGDINTHYHSTYQPALNGTGYVTISGTTIGYVNAVYSISTHTHGNITSTGYLGSTSSVPLITGTAGIIQAGSFGSAAGTFAQGNDSRFGVNTAAVTFTTTGGAVAGTTYNGSVARTISYATIGAAALAGSISQAFSVSSLSMAGALTGATSISTATGGNVTCNAVVLAGTGFSMEVSGGYWGAYNGTWAIRASSTAALFPGSITLNGSISGISTLTASSSVTGSTFVLGTTGWSLEVSGSKLIMKYGGSAMMSVDTSGNIRGSEVYRGGA